MFTAQSFTGMEKAALEFHHPKFVNFQIKYLDHLYIFLPFLFHSIEYFAAFSSPGKTKTMCGTVPIQPSPPPPSGLIFGKLSGQLIDKISVDSYFYPLILLVKGGGVS